ncbi:family 78 glycoside hydrolase catalytic domain [Paenibacillus shunpengii]|uniref:alpha-L-rhamnosidase n=1 Tax=Paenibacillus shunpengii TaxID=2054424 RepID=A0ABW5SP46_9BACL
MNPQAALSVSQVTCEYREELLGSNQFVPRFGWKLNSKERGIKQQAYHLVVSDLPDFSLYLWDTGRIESDQSIHIEYGGPALQSRTRYYYRVKVWDQQGNCSEWSSTGWWETAFLSSNEWQAEWIMPKQLPVVQQAQEWPDSPPVSLLRTTFQLKQNIVSARVYATAAGLYDLHLNGERVGEELLAPGWTSYHHRHQYQTYDVTRYLHAGGNGIGIQAADGWYSGRISWEKGFRSAYGEHRAVLLELHVQYADGTEEVVVTDTTWKASEGPIRYTSIYDGEIYDARLEQAGWSEYEYDDSGWEGVSRSDMPYHPLTAQENWPVKVTETIHPISVLHTPRGETVLDMGQNMVGRVRIKMNLDEGTKITLYHAEVLDREGNFYTGNLRSAKQLVEYTTRGNGEDNYAPAFTFMGFRYIRIAGLEKLDDSVIIKGFTGEVMHSDMVQTGQFDCSDERVNRLQQNIVWGQRGNFVDIPTDCPQRDERLGWTGDAQVFIRTAAFNYQVAPFFAKWLRDLAADQREDGSVPFTIPNILKWNKDTSAAWGDAAVICPWTQYQCYGDIRLLSEQYDSMKAWVNYIRGEGEYEYLWNTGHHFGDWLALDAKENSYVGATPLDLIATSFYAYSVDFVRNAAVVLGRSEDVKKYSDLLYQVRRAYLNEFVTPAGRLAAPMQTAHVLALMFGLVEGDARRRTASELNRMVVQNGYHLTTGFVGTPYLCIVLSENGYHETAVKLLLQDSYPSWLYSITQGATTIWEHWDGIKSDGSFWSDDMNSYNHYAYGAIGDWMYRYLAGLDMEDSDIAYKKIRIHPRFAAGQLKHASAKLDSPYGRIESSWLEDKGLRTVQIQIPVNTEAKIILEGANLDQLLESGHPVKDVEGIIDISRTAEAVVLRAGSGEYVFSYKYS